MFFLKSESAYCSNLIDDEILDFNTVREELGVVLKLL